MDRAIITPTKEIKMARIPKERVKEVHIPGDEDNGMVVIRNLSLEEVAVTESNFMNITEKGPSFTNYADRVATLAKQCLKGWGNIKDEFGNDLEFNPKNVEYASALVIVEEKEGEHTRTRFFEWIDEERSKFAEELIEEEKKAKGN